MSASLFHFLIVLPIFVVVLMFIVLPTMQWLNVRLFGRRFILRFGRPLSSQDLHHRRDVIFSVVSFLLSIIIAITVLRVLIDEGIIPPLT